MPDPLAEATGGALGSLLTCVLLMPVDTAKVRIQAGRSSAHCGMPGTIHDIVSSEGVLALYRGLPSKALHTVLQNFLYFFTYEYIKARRSSYIILPGTLANTACGVMAGISNLTVTLPLETVIVRIQSSSENKSVMQHASELAREKGGLWRGFGVSSVLTLNPALTMAFFDALKSRLTRWTMRRLSVVEGFIVGSLAKALATILTYPLIRTKVVMQAQSALTDRGSGTTAASQLQQGMEHRENLDLAPLSPSRQMQQRPSSMRAVLLQIWRREGVHGLFRGCSAQILSAVAKSGLLLTSKERLAAFTVLLLSALPSTRTAGRRRSLAAQMHS